MWILLGFFLLFFASADVLRSILGELKFHAQTWTIMNSHWLSEIEQIYIWYDIWCWKYWFETGNWALILFELILNFDNNFTFLQAWSEPVMVRAASSTDISNYFSQSSESSKVWGLCQWCGFIIVTYWYHQECQLRVRWGVEISAISDSVTDSVCLKRLKIMHIIISNYQ